jgi:hypothetical protein
MEHAGLNLLCGQFGNFDQSVRLSLSARNR